MMMDGSDYRDFTSIVNYLIQVETPENNILFLGLVKIYYVAVQLAVLGAFITCLIMLISYNDSMLPNKACKPYLKKMKKMSSKLNK